MYIWLRFLHEWQCHCLCNGGTCFSKTTVAWHFEQYIFWCDTEAGAIKCVMLFFERGHQRQTFCQVSSTYHTNAQCCHNSDNVIVFAIALHASLKNRCVTYFEKHVFWVRAIACVILLFERGHQKQTFCLVLPTYHKIRDGYHKTAGTENEGQHTCNFILCCHWASNLHLNNVFKRVAMSLFLQWRYILQ